MLARLLAILSLGTVLVAPTAFADSMHSNTNETLNAEKLKAIQLAVEETLRLSLHQGCGRQDCRPHALPPLPACDSQGRRREGPSCTLVWKQEDGSERLVWIDEWELGPKLPPSYRLPVVGQDGRLY